MTRLCLNVIYNDGLMVVDYGVYGVPLHTLLEHDQKKYPHLKVPRIVEEVRFEIILLRTTLFTCNILWLCGEWHCLHAICYDYVENDIVYIQSTMVMWRMILFTYNLRWLCGEWHCLHTIYYDLVENDIVYIQSAMIMWRMTLVTYNLLLLWWE